MQCRNRVAFCKLFAHIRRSHDVRVKKFKKSLKIDLPVKQIDDWRFCVPILFMSKKQNIFFEMMRQKETWHVLTFYQGLIEERSTTYYRTNNYRTTYYRCFYYRIVILSYGIIIEVLKKESYYRIDSGGEGGGSPLNLFHSNYIGFKRLRRLELGDYLTIFLG